MNDTDDERSKSEYDRVVVHREQWEQRRRAFLDGPVPDDPQAVCQRVHDGLMRLSAGEKEEGEDMDVTQYITMDTLEYTTSADRFKYRFGRIGDNAYVETQDGRRYVFVRHEELNLARFFNERGVTEDIHSETSSFMEARADELRRAADSVDAVDGPGSVDEVPDWLRERADRLWPDRTKVDKMTQAIREALLTEPDTSEDELDIEDIRDLALRLVRGGKVQVVSTDG